MVDYDMNLDVDVYGIWWSRLVSEDVSKCLLIITYYLSKTIFVYIKGRA